MPQGRGSLTLQSVSSYHLWMKEIRRRNGFCHLINCVCLQLRFFFFVDQSHLHWRHDHSVPVSFTGGYSSSFEVYSSLC